MGTTILTIDGGGMKGIISCIVLMRLERYLKVYSKDETATIPDYFDLIAGTSTGSILTTFLLCPDENGRAKYTAKDALELYMAKGKEMFRKRPLYPINTMFGLLKSKYTNTEFRKELSEYFGELNISQLIKPCMLVTYDMVSRRTFFVNSISSATNESRDIKVVEAVLASCAAPTYFPPVYHKNTNGVSRCLIDGGVAANNPAMSALIEGLKIQPESDIKDTYLFSVANASMDQSYTCENTKRWGILTFAIPLFHIFMETSEEIVDYQVKKLYESLGIGCHYLRVEAINEKNIPAMDDTSDETFKRLVEIGHQLADQQEVAIRAFAKQLVETKKNKSR